MTSGGPVAGRAPSSVGGAGVTLAAVSKRFRNGTVAVSPTDLHVEPGSFVSIVGPSGCGKSTLLRMVAGLLTPSGGSVAVPPDASPAFVFQEPTLLPWRNVRRNCELLLEFDRVARAERATRARHALASVGLDAFERSYPRQLSGGMKMRLSLARALACDTRLMLMDEPFAAVDEITREDLNEQLQRLWLDAGFTALFVTHNVAEAVFLSQRVIVMSPRPGRVVADVAVQLDHPRAASDRTGAPFNAVVEQVAAALRGSR